MIQWLIEHWWLLAALIFSLAVLVYLHERSYRKLLTSELEKFGFEYISEESPDAFDTGPFPKSEKLSRSKLQTKFLGIPGNWITYRQVQFLDENKEECTSWARIRFDNFSVTDVTWNPILNSFAKDKGKKKRKR